MLARQPFRGGGYQLLGVLVKQQDGGRVDLQHIAGPIAEAWPAVVPIQQAAARPPPGGRAAGSAADQLSRAPTWMATASCAGMFAGNQPSLLTVITGPLHEPLW